MAPNGETLVIVESPTKARTIEGFFESDVTVESSMGHARPAAQLGRDPREAPFRGLVQAVDVEHGFQPLYIVPKEKRDQIRKLKKAMEGIEELFLATDEDREGESIAWHLTEVLARKSRCDGWSSTRSPHGPSRRPSPTRARSTSVWSRRRRRRVLDRLVGYEVSPVLWRMIQPRLSAGRVQSVAAGSWSRGE